MQHVFGDDRRPGPHGHRSTLYPATAISPELRPVLTGTRPWKRLVAFIHLRDHPTMRATAAALGIDPKAFASDIRRLERELGQQLVHRTRPPNPMAGLTDHGRTLAAAIANALELTPSLARTEITQLPGPVTGGHLRLGSD
ncbi:LysR family transcriptional regulator [Amycolatopsis sp. NPDC051071]|uniref:LysR family transcriptional regulator n=1 Tax=Amycolatopsis sp. NPDC051071 TaxID=3154637 RepID=UPI003445845D